jgi:hypothetical protein
MQTIAAGLFLVMLHLPAIPKQAQGFGHFHGNPQTEWDPDGRRMYVLQDFVYEDPDGKKWTAAKGSKIDGASIPQAFWWLVGGPFEGRYRNASIVHDTECQPPYKNDWKAVHRMFYNASRAGGVGQLKAKIMYMAVYHCGPRWPRPSDSCFHRDDFIRGVVVLRKNPTLSLGAIDAFTVEGLASQVSDSELRAERSRIDYRLTNGPGPGPDEDYY